jgi:hypothetical protein
MPTILESPRPAAPRPRPGKAPVKQAGSTKLLELHRLYKRQGVKEHVWRNLWDSKVQPRPGTFDLAVRKRKADFGLSYGLALKGNIKAMIGLTLDPSAQIMLRAAPFSNQVSTCGHCSKVCYSSTYSDVAVRALPSDGIFIGHCCYSGDNARYVQSAIQGGLVQRAYAVALITGENTQDMINSRWANFRRHAFESNGVYYSREEYQRRFGEDPLANMSINPRGAYGMSNPFNPSHERVIADYHSSCQELQALPSPHFDRMKRPLLIGIELEMEVGAGGSQHVPAARALKKLFNGDRGQTRYALFEKDGSVSAGFEMVTAWTGLDTHEKILSQLTSVEGEKIKKDYKLRSHDTSTCGLHVTIDRADMNKLHQGKFVVFFNHPSNRPLIETICRRYAEGYCRVKPEEFRRVSQVQHNTGGDRYEIVNFTKANVIEFRGPKGTLRFQTIMATMEFIRMAWLFTEQAAANRLSIAAFLDFVWRRENSFETRYLRDYMVERKIAKPDVKPVIDISKPMPGAESGAEQGEAKQQRRLTLTESLADAVAGGFLVVQADV